MQSAEILSDLIKKAQGNRSLNQFANQCGISPGNLSRIINNKNAQSPKPETLKKLAIHAYNGVTYQQLMDAAGHIKLEDASTSNLDSALSEKDEKDIEKQIVNLRKNLIENAEGLMLSGEPVSPEAIESVLDTLALGLKQAKIINKKYTPNKYKKK